MHSWKVNKRFTLTQVFLYFVVSCRCLTNHRIVGLKGFRDRKSCSKLSAVFCDLSTSRYSSHQSTARSDWVSAPFEPAFNEKHTEFNVCQ